jgi:hypothetical protein
VKWTNQQADRLFTAGRDSTIRVYTNLTPVNSIFMSNAAAAATSSTSSSSNSPNSSKSVSPNRPSDGSSDSSSGKYYQMSLSHHTDWVNDIVICKYTKTGTNRQICRAREFRLRIERRNKRFLVIFLSSLFGIQRYDSENLELLQGNAPQHASFA